MKTQPITDEQAKQMLIEADKAKANTYPEPGGYACAVLTAKGTIYHGAAYKSDTQTLTMHGEATALAHAAIHGETDIIAITGPNCHICKQLIWEHSLQTGIEIQVVIQEEGGVKLVPISELMPYPWPEGKVNS
jgi:cytidine deaminase